jgi:hypothetical protein
MLLLNNHNKEFKFYQIFTHFRLVYNDTNLINNKIYSFEINPTDEYEIDLDKIDLKLFIDKPPDETLIFDVKILDNIITWTNLSTDNQYTFSMKMSFSEPIDNEYNLPIFSFDYKKISKNRMPTLINQTYNLSSQFKFIIYNISSDTQFIIEICLDTGIKKNYFVSNDVKSIKQYLK